MNLVETNNNYWDDHRHCVVYAGSSPLHQVFAQISDGYLNRTVNSAILSGCKEDR